MVEGLACFRVDISSKIAEIRGGFGRCGFFVFRSLYACVVVDGSMTAI